MKSITLSDADVTRFWSKVKIGKPDECWEWQAYRSKSGYGKFGIRRITVMYAHRVSWMITSGDVPKGLVVAHRCDNPPCVNPSHLFVCTQEENWDDMRQKGRNSNGISLGEKHGLSKLTEKDVSEIRSLSKVLSNVKISEKFKVHPATIGNIVNGKTWNWLK